MATDSRSSWQYQLRQSLMIRFAALTGAIECICSVVIFGLPFYSNGVCWDAKVDGAKLLNMSILR
jgi:hypothetical protein